MKAEDMGTTTLCYVLTVDLGTECRSGIDKDIDMAVSPSLRGLPADAIRIDAEDGRCPSCQFPLGIDVIEAQCLGIDIAEQRPAPSQYNSLRCGSEGQGWADHVAALYINRPQHRDQRRRGIVETYSGDAEILGQLLLELQNVLAVV